MKLKKKSQQKGEEAMSTQNFSAFGRLQVGFFSWLSAILNEIVHGFYQFIQYEPRIVPQNRPRPNHSTSFLINNSYGLLTIHAIT
jgi:hypothetical protein